MIGISVALISILWLCVRRTGVAIALCFLLVGFVWRLLGAAYLNGAGPLYSYEAETIVGGDALAANMFGFLIALTVLVMAWMIRPAVLEREVTRLQPVTGAHPGLTIGDFVFYGGVLFILALFIDLFRIGVIPLVHCIERYEYLAVYAGPFHKILFKYGSLIALQLGIFAAYPRLRGGCYDWRFVALLAALFVYLPLTGNRFSAFYSLTLFFLMPLSLIWLLRSHSQFAVVFAARDRQMKRAKILWIVLPMVGAVIVTFSLLHSYANVRSEESVCAEYRSQQELPVDILESLDDFVLMKMISRFVSPEVQMRFSQRILVQPIHMYFLTSQRVIGGGDWQPHQARDFVFDPDRKEEGNRSIRFLMNRTLPPPRAAFLESVGNQFAGGYPEIMLELGGAWGVWILVVAMAAVTGWLLSIWMVALLRGRFLTAFFVAYVLYAFIVSYVGGMLNFLIVWTFWSKVALLVLFIWFEPWLERRGRPLLPWYIGWFPRLGKRV